ncbi:hypothetical protein [Microbulbifer epialgicus]|uniref:Pyridoxal-phosphate dependent enzyme n=1 Tax=Microbulbifer epialgicus TaxID=393907 RepID=A0ABV4P0Y8_9GAMM
MGESYGVVEEKEVEAIKLTAQLESILLDPVYTGRGMAVLIDMICKGVITAEDTALLWHTGGTPSLFVHADDLADTG